MLGPSGATSLTTEFVTDPNGDYFTITAHKEGEQPKVVLVCKDTANGTVFQQQLETPAAFGFQLDGSGRVAVIQ